MNWILDVDVAAVELDLVDVAASIMAIDVSSKMGISPVLEIAPIECK